MHAKEEHTYLISSMVCCTHNAGWKLVIVLGCACTITNFQCASLTILHVQQPTHATKLELSLAAMHIAHN